MPVPRRRSIRRRHSSTAPAIIALSWGMRSVSFQFLKLLYADSDGAFCKPRISSRRGSLLSLARNLLACCSASKNWRAYTWSIRIAGYPGFPQWSWGESISRARVCELSATKSSMNSISSYPSLVTCSASSVVLLSGSATRKDSFLVVSGAAGGNDSGGFPSRLTRTIVPFLYLGRHCRVSAELPFGAFLLSWRGPW